MQFQLDHVNVFETNKRERRYFFVARQQSFID